MMEKGLHQLSIEIDERTRAVLGAADHEQTDAAAARVVAERDQVRGVVQQCDDLYLMGLECRAASLMIDELKRWGMG